MKAHHDNLEPTVTESILLVSDLMSGIVAQRQTVVMMIRVISQLYSLTGGEYTLVSHLH
jgi:hypothetical protein